nr:ADP/ATP-dependent (S)-NAD(P)H-hydrate dehydratase [Mangrovicoccus ximenensis]
MPTRNSRHWRSACPTRPPNCRGSRAALADAEALRGVLADPRINAICLGPGLGTGERTRALVSAVLGTGRAAVLDADALTVFADDPERLFSMLHRRVVLTPHMGEFARLFPAEAHEMRAARTGLAQRRLLFQAVERAQAVVLLKGTVTRIADPGGGSAEHAATGGAAGAPRSPPEAAAAAARSTVSPRLTRVSAVLNSASAASKAAWAAAICSSVASALSSSAVSAA